MGVIPREGTAMFWMDRGAYAWVGGALSSYATLSIDVFEEEEEETVSDLCVSQRRVCSMF